MADVRREQRVAEGLVHGRLELVEHAVAADWQRHGGRGQGAAQRQGQADRSLLAVEQAYLAVEHQVTETGAGRGVPGPSQVDGRHQADAHRTVGVGTRQVQLRQVAEQHGLLAVGVVVGPVGQRPIGVGQQGASREALVLEQGGVGHPQKARGVHRRPPGLGVEVGHVTVGDGLGLGREQCK